MFALVTGASSGIGMEYAEQLAKDYHYDLFLVSNQEKELNDIAFKLSKKYNVKTITFFIDLSLEDAAEKVYQFANEQNIEVDVLVNNAGILLFKPLLDIRISKIQTLLMLHIVTLTKLCKLFGEDMCSRRRGYILNVSSMTAWMNMPGIQCYNASKSYVLNFSKALWYEFKPKDVRVLAVTPGTVNTSLFDLPEKMRNLLLKVGISMQPEKLVFKTLRKLFRTKQKSYLPGVWNFIIVPIISHLPDWFVFFVMKRLKLFNSSTK
jgi:short-subunit dehydrogenase